MSVRTGFRVVEVIKGTNLRCFIVPGIPNAVQSQGTIDNKRLKLLPCPCALVLVVVYIRCRADLVDDIEVPEDVF